jgi:hypothetical protein
MSEVDGNVHVIPVGENQPEHQENKFCWCEPELAEDYTTEGGKKMYLHKEIQ